MKEIGCEKERKHRKESERKDPRIGRIMTPEMWESMMKINIDEVKEVSGILQMKEEKTREEKKIKFYRASLEADMALFSDEVDKWRMLNILWAEATRWQYRIAGFSLLDDRMELLLYRTYDPSGSEPVDEGQHRSSLIRDIGQSYLHYYAKDRDIRPDMVCERSSWEELDSRENVLNACCQIHQLPVAEGYVTDLRDFWWSSYQNYHGRYKWSFLDISPVLGCLSRKMGTALRSFEQRQKNWGRRKETDT